MKRQLSQDNMTLIISSKKSKTEAEEKKCEFEYNLLTTITHVRDIGTKIFSYIPFGYLPFLLTVSKTMTNIVTNLDHYPRATIEKKDSTFIYLEDIRSRSEPYIPQPKFKKEIIVTKRCTKEDIAQTIQRKCIRNIVAHGDIQFLKNHLVYYYLDHKGKKNEHRPYELHKTAIKYGQLSMLKFFEKTMELQDDYEAQGLALVYGQKHIAHHIGMKLQKKEAIAHISLLKPANLQSCILNGHIELLWDILEKYLKREGDKDWVTFSKAYRGILNGISATGNITYFEKALKDYPRLFQGLDSMKHIVYTAAVFVQENFLSHIKTLPDMENLWKAFDLEERDISPEFAPTHFERLMNRYSVCSDNDKINCDPFFNDDDIVYQIKDYQTITKSINLLRKTLPKIFNGVPVANLIKCSAEHLFFCSSEFTPTLDMLIKEYLQTNPSRENMVCLFEKIAQKIRHSYTSSECRMSVVKIIQKFNIEWNPVNSATENHLFQWFLTSSIEALDDETLKSLTEQKTEFFNILPTFEKSVWMCFTELIQTKSDKYTGTLPGDSQLIDKLQKIFDILISRRCLVTEYLINGIKDVMKLLKEKTTKTKESLNNLEMTENMEQEENPEDEEERVARAELEPPSSDDDEHGPIVCLYDDDDDDDSSESSSDSSDTSESS